MIKPATCNNDRHKGRKVWLSGSPKNQNTEVHTMLTNKQLDNRVNKLRAIEAQQKELEAQAEAIRAELKADLESKGEDEHDTGAFVIRWKEIVSRRLDSRALKAALPDVFAAYSKESSTRRFSIA